MTDWNDLFIRTSISETSPTGRVGGLSSPDIIPYGTSPVNPSQFTTPDNYRTYVSNTGFTQGYPNYIYVRAKNSSVNTPANGVAYLALTNPAIVLWPGGDGWTQIQTNNHHDYSALQPDPTQGGTISVTQDPFVYDPPDSGHRCLVSWLSTTAHPVSGTPPKIDNISALVKFLIDNPNYAHHNLEIAPDTTGAVTSSRAFSSGTEPFAWRCGLQVTNCKGFDVSFSSSELLPDGKPIVLEPTTVQQDDTVAYLLGPYELPAGWDTYINYTYATNGIVKKDKFDVTFVAYYDVAQDSPLWAHASDYTELGVSADKAPAGRRGIIVGSVGMIKGASQ